jgi:signal peptide peptidase-like protein 2B
MITVLQVARLPNIKVHKLLFCHAFLMLSLFLSDMSLVTQVATVLLCCAFVYDIFWVFLSPIIFHQSVMIAVSINVTYSTLLFLLFKLTLRCLLLG